MIGRPVNVPLRELWENEAKDFTGWLAQNIDILSEQINLPLTVTETERGVGDFSADILAEDENGNLVIIENQLEITDHDHLGKMLTYLSNMDAKAAIWISSKPRLEHKKAMEWLNEFTDFSFYLIKIEAKRIGESEPAPFFTIVVGPSREARAIGTKKQELTEAHRLRKEFWESLLHKARKRTDLHANVSPGIESWIAAGAGRAGIKYSYVILKDRAQCELYFDNGKGSEELNKARFDTLYKSKGEIEREFGDRLEWERLDNRRACRIKFEIGGAGFRDKEKWGDLQTNLIDAMIRLEHAFKKHIKALK